MSAHISRQTPGFFHVSIDGRLIPVAKGIGVDRLDEEAAIEKARRILEARKSS